MAVFPSTVLVVTHDFSGFTGSEIVALEVANFFAANGSVVTVRAERNSSLLKPYLHPGIAIADSRVNIKDFEFVWSQHGHFCLNTDDLSDLTEWQGVLVAAHLSASTKAEAYHYPFSARHAGSVVFNCEATAEILMSRHEPTGACFNLRNAAPREFHIAPNPQGNEDLKRLLVVSNHLPKELVSAIRIARSEGIEVCHFGVNGSYRKITPADISHFDAVCSIGKTVQYALCGGKPVYCYDHFGGPGWLGERNFDAAERHNFSGRCSLVHKSARQIRDEWGRGFLEADAFVRRNWDEMSGRFDLENILFEIVKATQSRPLDARAIEEIDLMRGAMLHVEWIWPDVFATRQYRKGFASRSLRAFKRWRRAV